MLRRRYYRCLTAIETRFPISKEKSHAQVNFAWFDAFRPAKKISQYNIHFEKAAVLFNLASVLSQQGLSSDRQSAEGLTQACKLFQVGGGGWRCQGGAREGGSQGAGGGAVEARQQRRWAAGARSQVYVCMATRRSVGGGQAGAWRTGGGGGPGGGA